MNYTKLREVLTDHEGLKYKPYKCTAGKLTIGIGHNLDDRGVSPAVVDLMYEEDVTEVVADLKVIFTNFDDLPYDIQIVLADMRFQLGAGRFRKFKKMITAVKQSNWSEMIIQMKDSSWYKQTTNRANDLISMVQKCYADK